MLPETQAGTMTSLVNRYTCAETLMMLNRVGERLEGQLTDVGGHPITGAPVTIWAKIAEESGRPVLLTRTGRVPDGAATALFALRINAECSCSGSADLAIGWMQYHDDTSGRTVQESFGVPTSAIQNHELTRVHARMGEAVTRNSGSFAVTPDDPFTIKIPLRSSIASTHSGYLAVIFLSREGKERLRLRFPLGLTDELVERLTTSAQGRFSLLPALDVLQATSGYRADFSGDPQYRMSSASVP
jgi:hypothetical protein